MLNCTAAFIGGGLGALTRYLTGITAKKIFVVMHLPYDTLFVNAFGSLILGVCIIFFASRPNLNPAVKTLLTVGFCGGLTTFSTFSSECLSFLTNGNFNKFSAYVVLSLIISMFFAYSGVQIAKRIF